MALLDVVTLPGEVLRQKARKVTNFGPELQNLVDDMVETMRDAPGVGLAAPQVGESLRLIVVEFGDEEDEEAPSKLYTIVNPEISRYANEVEVGAEGCLSVPGFMGEVERHMGITVKGFNRHGQPTKLKAKGWLARIFQHEIDHLDGVLFIDRADKVWTVEDAPIQAVPFG